MKTISVEAFKEVLDVERGNDTIDFINVCTPIEYKDKHIEGVRSVPLDEIEKRVNEFSEKKTIFIHCRSGKRGAQAIEKLTNLGVTAELINVEGGMLAWEGARFPVRAGAVRIPLMRQVFIAASTLILAGYLLGATVAYPFTYLGAFVAFGLLIAGLTGWCGMSVLLARMPWNK